MTGLGASRVLGLAVVRDDWPMLELAVTHALLHHADDVLVVDHGSTDATAAGLARAAGRWQGRLHVLRAGQAEFWQEAMVAAALEAVGAAERYDWIYPFDADEFLLTGEGGLRSVLASFCADTHAVRYELHNWLAPSDFDMAQLAGYAALRARAVPTEFGVARGADRAAAVAGGRLNFFDLPFPTKVVFRPAGAWLAAGAHHLKAPGNARTQPVAAHELRAAHLPLVSLRRLRKKARHGQRLVESGFGPDHGWQNQMFARLDEEGRLDGFWLRHCADPPPGTEGPLPTVVNDGAFAEQIAPALAALAQRDGGGEPAASGGTADLHGLAVALARRLQLVADQERERAASSHSAWQASAADALERERQARKDEHALRQQAEAELAGLRGSAAARDAELAGLEQALGRLRADRDRLRAEVRELARRYHVLVSSRSWRITAPIRRARGRRRRRTR